MSSGHPDRAARKHRLFTWWMTYFEHGQLHTLHDFVTEDYVQHLPMLKAGPDGINDFMTMFGGTMKSRIVRLIDDGELISILFEANSPPGGPAQRMTVIDIFKMNGDKFCEHWAVAAGYAADEFAALRPTDAHFPELPLSPEEESRNLAAVRTAFEAGLAGDSTAFAAMQSEDFVDHCREVQEQGGDLFSAYRKALGNGQELGGRIVRAAADNDIVFLHVLFQFPDGTEWLAAELFRVHAGKLLEHWAVHEVPMPESQRLNANGVI